MKSFFMGIGLGVVAGLLFAPKRGAATRAELRRTAQEWIREISSSFNERTRPRSAGIASNKPHNSAEPIGIREGTNSDASVLNTASIDSLIGVHGIGPVLADRIIQNRPYKSAYELVEKGILPESTFIELQRELLDKSA